MAINSINDICLNSCALCGSTDKLMESHLIPKFVFRWLKTTSVGKMRSAMNPNVSVQDGFKFKMLCASCEKMFSAFERTFANEIFYPFQRNSQNQFAYEEWLQIFTISLSWRLLYMHLLVSVNNQRITMDGISCFTASERIMREYLLGQRSDIANIENHLFFFDEIEHSPDDLKDLRPHMNIFRGIGSLTDGSEKYQTYYTYTNMMGILVFTLYRKPKHDVWTNTRVYSSGTIVAKQQHIDSFATNAIIYQLKRSEDIRSNISENQQQVIEKRFDAISEMNVENYPIFNLAYKDIKLRGEELD